MVKVPAIIAQNPYRVLGVFTTAHVKDRVAKANRIKAYARVGKAIDFTLDFNSILPPVDRSADALAKASSQFNLAKNQLRYALFWFANTDNFDDISLRNLDSGNITKAKDIMSKRTTFSTLVNRGIIALIEGDYKTGVSSVHTVISDPILRTSFIKSVCGDDYTISADGLSQMFNEELLTFIAPGALLNIYKSIDGTSSIVHTLGDKAASQYEQQIDAEVTKARNVDANNAKASYEAGVYLQNATATRLNSLLQILGKDNLRYQRMADRVALQVLQCSINYFNHTTESKSQAINKALVLASYASTIAVGMLAKDRIKKNVDILNNMKAEAAVEDDLNFITSQLNAFQSKPDTIENARQLLNDCYRHLRNLKNALGTSNEVYLQVSTAVAGNARGMLVSFFNSKQQNRNISRSDLISYADQTITVLNKILSLLDINAEEKSRCQKDVRTLKLIKEDLKPKDHSIDTFDDSDFDYVLSQGYDAGGALPHSKRPYAGYRQKEASHKSSTYTPRYPNGSSGATRTTQTNNDDNTTTSKNVWIVAIVMILLMVIAISVNKCNNESANGQQNNPYIAVVDSDTTAIDTTYYEDVVDTAVADTTDYSYEEPLSEPEETSIDYAALRPKTDSKPYADVYGRGRSGDNWLDFNTSGSSDYVVIVRKYGTKKVINHIYIRGGEDARLYLPNGTYTIYFYSGSDWNPDKKMGKVTGGFDSGGSTQKDGPVELYGQYGEYTLYPVQNGNLQLQSAGSETFE